MEWIHIAMAGDNNYAEPMCVALLSLLDNKKSDHPMKVHIIDGGISERNKRRIYSLGVKYNVPIEMLYIDQTQFYGFDTYDYINLTTYYRILIPEILGKEVNKVIYLDSDIIVKDDITNFWNIDINNHYLGAIEDNPEVVNAHRNYLGIPDQYSYFNAGILLINLKKWRQGQISNMIMNYIRNRTQPLRLVDQDALNATMYDKWYSIDSRWNVQTFFYRENEEKYVVARENPAILHFTEKSKPWHKYYSNYSIKREYLFYETKLLIMKNYTLIKGSSKKIYIIIDGKKHWIVYEDLFEELGFDWRQVKTMDDEIIQSIPTGSPIRTRMNYESII